MPEPVRCDICGKLFSSRHVGSHKRLAHAKDQVRGLGGGPADSERGMESILKIYKTLSADKKKRVLAQLTRMEQEPS